MGWFDFQISCYYPCVVKELLSIVIFLVAKFRSFFQCRFGWWGEFENNVRNYFFRFFFSPSLAVYLLLRTSRYSVPARYTYLYCVIAIWNCQHLKSTNPDLSFLIAATTSTRTTGLFSCDIVLTFQLLVLYAIALFELYFRRAMDYERDENAEQSTTVEVIRLTLKIYGSVFVESLFLLSLD